MRHVHTFRLLGGGCSFHFLDSIGDVLIDRRVSLEEKFRRGSAGPWWWDVVPCFLDGVEVGGGGHTVCAALLVS